MQAHVMCGVREQAESEFHGRCIPKDERYPYIQYTFPSLEQPWWQHDSIHEPRTTYVPSFYAVDEFKS